MRKTSRCELTSVEIEGMKAEELAKKTDIKISCVNKQYDALIAAAPKAERTPWGPAETKVD
jgi:hypothetical protein